ncbi:hypothetical protein M422DRAFT_244419 [Sphaerobolus stellatus SS14]|nr:hypothetical protein M422DRAFT_244419 [Sphaerobolus stellatus SS14]
MVKRVPTPPPGDDEPRVLAVKYPYPPHPSLERPQELHALVWWLACAMGEGHHGDLYSVCHKPTAAEMVLIEVRRNFPGYRRLLGAHKWSDFVKQPGRYHDQVSRIYFSTYPNGRAVEKAGWKRIFVEDAWFQNFSINNRFIVDPYPLSTYCQPLAEDQTSGNICRPIPLDLFNMRLPTPPPVPVGSQLWIKQKEAGITPTSKKALPTPRARPAAPIFMSNDFVEPPASTILPIVPDYDEMDYPDEGEYVGSYEVTTALDNEFDKLKITAPEPEKPLCPTHQIVCKKGICSDYRDLLRKLERQQKNGPGTTPSPAPQGRGRGRGIINTIIATNSVTNARGRGNGYTSESRSTSSHSNHNNNNNNGNATSGKTIRPVSPPPAGNAWKRGPVSVSGSVSPPKGAWSKGPPKAAASPQRGAGAVSAPPRLVGIPMGAWRRGPPNVDIHEYADENEHDDGWQKA